MTLQTAQTLVKAAQDSLPLTLTSLEVRELALTLMGMDNMIAAYVNEYGSELLDELTGSETVVEGEVIEDDEAETETGLSGENDS